VLKLREEEVQAEFFRAFKNRFINLKERFALSMYEGKCILICHVDSFVSIDVKNNQTFGVLEFDKNNETDVVCKPKNPKALKIESNRMVEK
jgi:hypothetical protein